MSPELPMERLKTIEHIVGEFLYYVRGVYNSCLFLFSIMSTINDPAEQNEKDVHQFLDYMATTTNEVVRFHTSDMILRADTDELYLTGPEARSHAVEYFLLGRITSKCTGERLNGAIHVNSNTLKFVAASSAEEENGGCFVTGIDIIRPQNTLEEMFH